jgi:uridylate kinase
MPNLPTPSPEETRTMADAPAYSRILLKLSGEALKGDLAHGYDADAVGQIVRRVAAVIDGGVEVALVVGAGNVWRGMVGTAWGMDRVTADTMGMLATAMNALCLRDAFNAAGLAVEAQSAIPIGTALPPFNRQRALDALAAGKVVIFGGGTGSPFFTTDTTAALRALEIEAQAVLKATKVDGVYTADPKTHPDAERYATLSYEEALAKRLKIMDATAFSLCRDNGLPIIVFNFSAPDSLERVVAGDTSIATVIR